MARKRRPRPEIVSYVGRGRYMIGVPARDMTRDEWDSLDEVERDVCLALGLYEIGEVVSAVGIDDWPVIIGAKEND